MIPDDVEETYNFHKKANPKEQCQKLPHIGKILKIECNLMSSGSLESLESTRL